VFACQGTDAVVAISFGNTARLKFG